MEQVGLAEGLAEQVTEWDRLASIEVSRYLGKPVLAAPRKGFCEFTHRLHSAGERTAQRPGRANASPGPLDAGKLDGYSSPL